MVIKFFVQFTSTSLGIIVPELTIVCVKVTILNSVKEELGKVISIWVERYSSLASYNADKNALVGGELKEHISCTEKVEVTIDGIKTIIDNVDYTTYFSDSAIVNASGNIILQALKYFREVYLVSEGIPLQASVIV